jgi:hypothetical protein
VHSAATILLFSNKIPVVPILTQKVIATSQMGLSSVSLQVSCVAIYKAVKYAAM